MIDHFHMPEHMHETRKNGEAAGHENLLCSIMMGTYPQCLLNVWMLGVKPGGTQRLETQLC